MNLDISTPALLFPAITLLLLAFTNRFLAIATLIRNLNSKYQENPNRPMLKDQIKNLRTRLNMIRYMQAFGILSFFLTVLCMFLLFQGRHEANYLFGASLVSLMTSLAISFREIQISTKALNIELGSMENN